MIYKAAREVARQLAELEVNLGVISLTESHMAELISAKFYSLVEVAKTAKRVLADTGNEATVELLGEALGKIV